MLVKTGMIYANARYRRTPPPIVRQVPCGTYSSARSVIRKVAHYKSSTTTIVYCDKHSVHTATKALVMPDSLVSAPRRTPTTVFCTVRTRFTRHAVSPQLFEVQSIVDVRVDEPHKLADVFRC